VDLDLDLGRARQGKARQGNGGYRDGEPSAVVMSGVLMVMPGTHRCSLVVWVEPLKPRSRVRLQPCGRSRYMECGERACCGRWEAMAMGGEDGWMDDG
jgi:hypothetical protein